MAFFNEQNSVITSIVFWLYSGRVSVSPELFGGFSETASYPFSNTPKLSGYLPSGRAVEVSTDIKSPPVDRLC